MGTVSFQFQGICVNFRGEDSHRVVLLNLDREFDILGHQIPPHMATMTINDEPSFRLEGCAIRFPPGGPFEPPRAEPSFRCVFNLTELMREKRQERLGPPSVSRVEGVDPALTAARFEFPTGRISGIASMGAASTEIQVTTEGDLELALVPFPTSAMTPQTFRLGDGAIVSVANMASKENELVDHHFHFLLSYLTAEQYPADPFLPTDSEVTCPAMRGLDWTAGASCSNSNYP